MTSATSSSGRRSTSIPTDAQVTAVSDPLPQILEGIPLRAALDPGQPRPARFTLNPTNCDPFSVDAHDHRRPRRRGQPQPPLPGRQLRDPALRAEAEPEAHAAASSAAATRRSTRLFTARAGRSEHRRDVSVTLPHGELLDNAHIGNVCTTVQFAAERVPRRLGARHRRGEHAAARPAAEGHRLPALDPNRTSCPTSSPTSRARSTSSSTAQVDIVNGRPAHHLRDRSRRPGELDSPSTSPAAPRACCRTARASAAGRGTRDREDGRPERRRQRAPDPRLQIACGSKGRHKRDNESGRNAE